MRSSARSWGIMVLFMAATTAFAQVSLPLDKVETQLVAKYGEARRGRIHKGLHQVSEFWRAEDGNAEDFEGFTADNFAGDQQTLDALFDRLQFAFESLDGHLLEVGRDWRRQSDLDLGTVYPFDDIMNGFDVTAHISDDLFENKLAFVVLLNFPLTTLDERLKDGHNWSRRQWAETRMAMRFADRVPASVNAALASANASTSQFVDSYNIWMYHVLDGSGQRLFPANMRLLEHWNLRDQIKADYADPSKGLPRQRLVLKVMERIVDQTIPSEVVDNPGVDWDPVSNKVVPAKEKDSDNQPRGLTGPAPRYAAILEAFHANQLLDKYSPTAPTLIKRSFDEGREIPEDHVRAMLEKIVSSPMVPRVAALIKSRLNRQLEPFDLWYSGFQARAAYDEAKLDEMTRKRYPTPEAYHADMPRFFEHFGFTPEKAKFLADHIIVDPARGSGHAMFALRRGDLPHLRTRIAKDGMDYKGFNIAVHEMGHNVEQIFSLYNVDYHSMAGVPNTAITEALAFVFQRRDLELLGLAKPAANAQAMYTLNEFWNTYEISGVALVDMEMWHWLYDHPDANAEQLRDAVVQISKDIWNKYYEPALGGHDCTLLGIYAHMVNNSLYLPNYAIGHVIAFQIEQQMRKAGKIGSEFERMASYGDVAPDLWMENATGSPISADALLKATEDALTGVEKGA